MLLRWWHIFPCQFIISSWKSKLETGIQNLISDLKVLKAGSLSGLPSKYLKIAHHIFVKDSSGNSETCAIKLQLEFSNFELRIALLSSRGALSFYTRPHSCFLLLSMRDARLPAICTKYLCNNHFWCEGIVKLLRSKRLLWFEILIGWSMPDALNV